MNANGELWTLYTHMRASEATTLLFVGTAAFGGVRILSQFLFLSATSPTSLAISNTAIPIFTIALSVVLFHESINAYTGAGIGVTAFASIVYTAVKLRQERTGDQYATVRPKERQQLVDENEL